MTKGTKIFRIIISALLALTIISTAFFAFLFVMHINKDVMGEGFGIYVAGVSVTKDNKDDILGDGAVYYDEYDNILTFDNATIDSESWPVYSKIDLNVQLVGENKFVCKNEVYSGGIYAGDNHLSKDLSFIGDGSLIVEIPKASGEAVGIFADELTVTNDISVIISECENMVNGSVCSSSLVVANKGKITVNSGSAKNSVGVRVRGNALFEEGTALNVSVNPGTTEICKGFSVSGDVFLGKDTSLEVVVDDKTTDRGECIRVSGLMEVGIGSTVTASAKNSYAIECFGAIEAKKDSAISAVSDKKDSDIFCSGAVVNCGATVNAETDALGGVHNRTEN